MAVKYIRVKVNSLVKSDQTTRRCMDFSYQKTYGDAVSTCDIVLKRQTGTTGTTEDDTDFVTGKAVQVWMSDTLTTGQVAETSGNLVFSGYIEDREIDLFKITLKCADRLILARWQETGEVPYTSSDVTTIFQNIVDIVETASGITFNYSTFGNTGTVLDKFILENNNCYEKLWELANIVGWQFYYDVTNDVVRFEPRGTPTTQTFSNTASGTSKDQNGNIVNWTGLTVNTVGNIRWAQDSKDLTNDFNIVGGQTEIIVTNENHTVTLGTQNYVLSDSKAGGRNTDTQIYNISVVGNPGSVTLVQGVDYVVYESATPPGFIHFPVAPSTLGYTSIVFNYTYKINASAVTNTNDATSITNYIKRTKTITKRDIISTTDIGNYVTTLLTGFKNPITDTNFDTRDSIITPVIGSKVNVYDGIINRSVVATGTPVPIITQVIKHWPHPTTTVVVSTKPLKYENQTQTYFDRIDKLDKELTTTNAQPFLKLDGSVPVQGDLYFGKKTDGNISELKNPVVHRLSTAPTALSTGQMYYDTTANVLYYWNNVAWQSMAGGGVGGSGTTDKLPKWTASTTLGDSKISESGTTVTIAAVTTALNDGVNACTLNVTKAGALKGQVTAYNTDDFRIIAGAGYLFLSGTSGIKVDSTLTMVSAGIVMDGNALSECGLVTPKTTDTHDLGSSLLFWDEVYARKYYVDDANTYIWNSSGNMIATVGTNLYFGVTASNSTTTQEALRVTRHASTEGRYVTGYIGTTLEWYITTGSNIVSFVSNTSGDLRIQSNSGQVHLLPNTVVACGGDFLPDATTFNLGNAASYWNDVSYKTLTDRGCLGWFDEGVELRDGRKVSDVEALMNIKQHPTELTVYGVPRLDYKSMPKSVYRLAVDEKGNPYPRDENDKPYKDITSEKGKVRIYAEDGAETTALISIMIGAIKELNNRLNVLEKKNEAQTI